MPAYPVTTSAAQATGRFGARARPTDANPSTMAEMPRKRASMVARWAIRSDPISEPTLNIVIRRVYVVSRAAQVHLGEHREDHLVVEGEGADDGHEQERQPHVVDRPGVAEARPQLALLLGHPVGRRERAGVHAPDADERGDEREAVDDEAPADADRRDEDAGEGGPDDAGRRDQDRVEADGVRDVVGRDEVVDEGASSRVVEGVRQAQEAGEDVDGGDGDVVGQHEEPEGEGGDEHHRARDGHEPALVVPVDDDPRPCAEEQRREELGGHEQPERRAAVGQVVDEQVLGDELQPGAGERDRLRGEEDAEVAVPQRAERVPHRSRSITVIASASATRSSSVRAANFLASQALRRVWARSSTSSPRGGELEADDPAVVLAGQPVDEASLGEGVGELRRHRRGDPLGGGEVAQGDGAVAVTPCPAPTSASASCRPRRWSAAAGPTA